MIFLDRSSPENMASFEHESLIKGKKTGDLWLVGSLLALTSESSFVDIRTILYFSSTLGTVRSIINNIKTHPISKCAYH